MGALDALAAAAVEWALTYLIHSTLLLGLVAALTHRLVTSDTWRETLWRGALLGSILTASVATAAPFDPLGGRWTVAGADAVGAPATAPAPPVSTADGSPDGARDAQTDARTSSTAPSRVDDPGAAHARRVDAGAATAGGDPADGDARPGPSDGLASRFSDWAIPLTALWAVVAIVLLAVLVRRNVRVARRLRGRERLTAGPLVELLAEVRRLSGLWKPIRLSVSSAFPTPAAIGAAEICVPPRFVDGLGREEQRAALAHELAHVARRDPLWQLGTAVLNAALFFQPLNRVARLRLRETAEHLCDDWAVRRTGSPLALGRCLADIASWVSADAPLRPLHATSAMAEGGSPLLHRVRRIAAAPVDAPPSRLPALLATALLLLSVLGGAPAVGVMSARSESLDRAAGPADPPATALAARWREAVETAPEDRFWIGWGIRPGPEFPAWPIISSTPSPSRRDGPPLSEALARAGVKDEPPGLALLFGFDAEGRRTGDLDWMLLRSTDAPTDLAGMPLRWLGTASHEESIQQLRWLFDRSSLAEVRAEILVAYTLHEAGPTTQRAIDDGLAAASDEEVRAEATDWLGNQDTEEAIAILERLAMGDPAPSVRREAASGLDDFDNPAAVRALIRLARSAPDPRVRSEAVQELDTHHADAVARALLDVAFEDSVAYLRVDAVDALADMPIPTARAALRRLAQEHPDAAIRRQALEALTDPEE